MSYPLSQIATIIGARQDVFPDTSIEHLLLDSRKLVFPESSLFFALKGNSTSGVNFIPTLYAKGLRSFVVEQDLDLAGKFPGASFLEVSDVAAALQYLAAFHRHQFDYPVIGITGSNGKTMVKEWLFHLLNEQFHIVRSPKSYNSQVGVPLSAWKMNETHQLALIEAGVSKVGEMRRLEKIISPDIGIISFVGEAHASGFENIQQKIQEKLLLFLHSRLLIYCSDDDELHRQVNIFKAELNPELQLLAWSYADTGSWLFVEQVEKQGPNTRITCRHQQQQFMYSIPFTDEASIHNSITCFATGLVLGADPGVLTENMLHLRKVEMRLELKQGINNCSIINDSYNADIDSFLIALDFLQQQQQHNKRTVVLSDFLQSGKPPGILYKEISNILQQTDLHRFVGIGEDISKHAEFFKALPNVHFFKTVDDFLAVLAELQFRDETILLKAARVFRFERISRALEQKMHETFLEIDLNALRNNLAIYKRQLKPGTRIMAMVKAFSYGSGSFEIASLLQHAGTDYLGVAYADEGVELRKAGIRLPVMVMNTEAAGFENIVRYGLEPELYSFKILAAFKSFLAQHNIQGYNVHIKVDTGMHRLGFEEADIPRLSEELADKAVHVRSVFSHLVASDDPVHDGFTKKQAASFNKMSEALESALGYSFLKHLGNSSAIHRHPDLQLDMVRLGIGLYGVDPFPSVQEQLENVTCLKTTISQIRKVKAGESVGYSRKGIVERDATIATVRIGYADGYPRSLGLQKGKMLVNGQLAPVIGNVCMDMTMLDITGIAAEEEDEVIVFGEALPVTVLAEWAGTIPYEILTNISQRVKRVYFEE